MFVAALVLFSLTSLAGGLAPSSGLLIIARGVQGFSCALMAASSLAIITSSFPPGPQLHRAIGLWAAMNGAGGAAGTLLGGVITEDAQLALGAADQPPDRDRRRARRLCGRRRSPSRAEQASTSPAR